VIVVSLIARNSAAASAGASPEIAAAASRSASADLRASSARRRLLDERHRFGRLAGAHERGREVDDVGRGPPIDVDRAGRRDREVPREVRGGLGGEQAERVVVTRAGECFGGFAHRLARALNVVESIVVEVGELEQRVALLGAGRQPREVGEKARGGVEVAELDRQLRELAHELGIAGRDVVRGLERGERIDQPAAGARALGRIAQR
jgi:hypothetical protein